MKSIPRQYRSLPAIALLVACGAAFAHSEHGVPLYVAEDGRDAGRCQEPEAPCRTLAYALSRVGKGGEIRVAGGRYDVSDIEDVFHLVSGVVKVRGGFARRGFRRDDSVRSILVGVPSEYRALLSERGFHLVADRKGVDRAVAEATGRLLALHDRLKTGLDPVPCVGGQAGGLDCDKVDLVAHVPFADVSAGPAAAADVWGFVDLNSNREYAIVSYDIGTAVFDVTDPGRPREVGFVEGQRTTWRDIKVHQFFDPSAGRFRALAYVTTDGSSDGLFVVDLSGLPQRIQRLDYPSDFSAAHNVYAANTDYGTGLALPGAAASLIVAGSNNGGGRFRSYNLSSPDAPAFAVIPNVSNNDYMHDAASMLVTDDRRLQCINGVDHCEVLFDFNEGTVDVWDITVPGDPRRLSRTPYTNVGYTHSGWPSEDGNVLFVHDELDEQQFALNTTVRVFSLDELAAPLVEIGRWSGPTRAIDHNGFVRGNRYYISNYSRGLTVLDISDPSEPELAGFIDTYPFSDGSNFAGAWGAYPFFHSGNVAVSDIDTGFYMLSDRSLDVPEGSLGFASRSFGGDESGVVTVTVRRENSASGAISAAYQLVPATAASEDLASVVGNLSWDDGDMSDRVIEVSFDNDGIEEGLEHFLVRLIAPTGGATLARGGVASLYVADPGAGAIVAFDRPAIGAAEQGFATAIAVVRRTGSAAGAAAVDWAVSGGTAGAGADFEGATGGSLAWSAGDADPKWIEFAIVDDGLSEGAEHFEVTLSGPVGAALGSGSVLRIDIADSAGNRAPSAVAGAARTVESGATVILDGSASSDPDGDPLSYRWTQTSGPSVTLSEADSATASFTAPAVTTDTLLRFRLSVTDSGGLSNDALTDVTVVNEAASLGGGGSGALGSVTLLLLLLVSLARLVQRVPGGRLTRTGAA